MRWKAWIGGLASLLALAGGCKQRVFMTSCDLEHYQNLMPAHFETDAQATAAPTIESVPRPPSVLDSERTIRYISLAECISIALEQGTIGNPTAPLANATGNFIASDQPVTFSGQATAPTDAIRVLALDPAIFGAGIDQSLSKFDAVWASSMNWTFNDQAQATTLTTTGINTGLSGSGTSPIFNQQDILNTGIYKPLPAGGVAGITFRTEYDVFNPAFTGSSAQVYRPAVQLQFEQPLLQGFGVEINQLRAAHPGSILPNSQGIFNTQPTTSGILVTRIRFDQQRAEFERQVQIQVTNVELAYWNLYNGYWTLYARESAMRQAYEAWKISSAKYAAGRVSVADLAQTRGQYELFRDQRITALDALLESERQLRAMLGMHVEDGTSLIPSDAPTLAPYNPDWDSALKEALALRPELFLAREEVKVAQLNVTLAKNLLLPDLRFTSTYDDNSVGNMLDGSGSGNALRNLASNRFNNIGVGLRLNVPLGFRNAQANLRIARLQLARTYQVLHDNELKTERLLGAQYRNLFTNYEHIRALRAAAGGLRRAAAARFQEFLAGRGTLDLLLEAQRFWADALSNEYTAIAAYNKSLAQFEFAKGSILIHDNIVISEGALPNCAQVRAVEHQRERTAALVLRERAQPVIHAPLKEGCAPVMPQPADQHGPVAPLPDGEGPRIAGADAAARRLHRPLRDRPQEARLQAGRGQEEQRPEEADRLRHHAAGELPRGRRAAGRRRPDAEACDSPADAAAPGAAEVQPPPGGQPDSPTRSSRTEAKGERDAMRGRESRGLAAPAFFS